MTRQRALTLCLWVGALHLLLLAWVCFRRIGYPFDVEWMEGGQLTHAVRLRQGLPLYARPSVDFTAFFYTPLYPVVVALLAPLGGGVGYALGRAVSVAGTLATLALLFWTLRREAGTRLALLGAGTYAALDRFAGTFTSVARADALALALAFAAVVLGYYGQGRRTALASACLAVLAVFTKQTMVVLGGALFLWLLLQERRRALWFGTAALVLGVAGSLGLERHSGGWFSFYVMMGHQTHAMHWDNLTFYFWRDVLFLAPALLIVPLVWAWARFGRGPVLVLASIHLAVAFLQRALTLDYPPHMYFRELAYESPRWLLLVPPLVIAALLVRRGPRLEPLPLRGAFWLWMFGAALVSSALGHATQWAYKNAFMPAALFGAVFLPLALRDLAPVRRSALVAMALQLALLFDAPASRLPSASDHAKAAALRQRIAAVQGPVLVLAHPLLAVEHDGRVHTHQMGLSDVAMSVGVEAFEAFAAAHAWAAVIVDAGDGLEVPSAIRAHYRRAEAIDGPWMKTGIRVRPAELWLPKLAP